MQARKLILVRHSQSEIVTGLPANRWHLSAAGRRLCEPLARRLSAYSPDVIVSSVEPKAVETGQIVAARLGKPFEMGEGLHEHERPNVGFLDREAFETQVAAFFEQPERLVLGAETAARAQQRFEEAVRRAIAKHPGDTVAVVAHGTVITLLVAPLAGVDAFQFWKGLGMPAFVVCALPTLTPLAIVEQIQAE